MQITSFQNYSYSTHTNFGSKFKPKSVVSSAKKLEEIQKDGFEYGSFGSIRSLLLEIVNTPINNDEVYKKTLDRVMNEKTIKGESAWFSAKDLVEYDEANFLEKGLVPYCGFDDKSKYINMYMSGRLTPQIKQQLGIKDSSFSDVVRILDYSLKKLDKRLGKFDGIVYRQGFMSEIPGQYISTSSDYMIAACLNGSYINFMPGKQYSVIRTHNGHKIKDFQNELGLMFANTEKEILLPKESRYRKLKDFELDDELIKARENVASHLFYGSDLVINGMLRSNKGFSKQNLLDMVGVYEEII